MKKSKKSAQRKGKENEGDLIGRLAEEATSKASQNAVTAQGYTTVSRDGKVVRVNDKGEVIETLGGTDR